MGLSGILSGAVILPFLGALLHPPLGWLFQKGEDEGLPMSVTVGVANLATVLAFALYLRPDWSLPWGAMDALALLNGIFFFGGVWFSVQAVKAGDLVVHSSALGIKLILVAGMSIAIGLEKGSVFLGGAVLLGAVAIFLLAGGDLRGWQKHRATLGWTLVGTMFFGISDTLTSWKSSEIGAARWLMLMILASGCCALLILAPKAGVLKRALAKSRVRWILCGIGLLMGAQAIFINTAFARYQEPTVTNIVFSTRGLLVVPFLMLLQRSWRGVVSAKTLLGAGLMLVALVLAVWG